MSVLCLLLNFSFVWVRGGGWGVPKVESAPRTVRAVRGGAQVPVYELAGEIPSAAVGDADLLPELHPAGREIHHEGTFILLSVPSDQSI